jgi:hypothetical protein
MTSTVMKKVTYAYERRVQNVDIKFSVHNAYVSVITFIRYAHSQII